MIIERDGERYEVKGVFQGSKLVVLTREELEAYCSQLQSKPITPIVGPAELVDLGYVRLVKRDE